MESNLTKVLDKHLQLPSNYTIEQDKKDKLKIHVYKHDEDIDELIGSYILENTDVDEIYEVCKEILGDIYE